MKKTIVSILSMALVLTGCAPEQLGGDQTFRKIVNSPLASTAYEDGTDALPAVTSGGSNVPQGTNIDRPFPVNGKKKGVTWQVTTVCDGIKYYHGYGKPTETWMDGGNSRYQELYVIALDLTKTQYKVKLVKSTTSIPTSTAFAQTGAIAAINCAYEFTSIAMRANAILNTATGQLVNYPNGKVVATMPNDSIGNTTVPNWKSEGAFYCDGERGVRIAFDRYNGGCTDNNGTGTTVKSLSSIRSYYNTGSIPEAGFVSSAPILAANYTLFGRTFVTRNSSTSGGGEAPGNHQSQYCSRTAVAIAYPDGVTPHLLLIVCDGRYNLSNHGYGMSALWLTRYIANYFGPRHMLNLDGGGSSTMCVMNQGDATTHVVNYPTDNCNNGTVANHSGERNRPSFIVIVPAGS